MRVNPKNCAQLQFQAKWWWQLSFLAEYTKLKDWVQHSAKNRFMQRYCCNIWWKSKFSHSRNINISKVAFFSGHQCDSVLLSERVWSLALILPRPSILPTQPECASVKLVPRLQLQQLLPLHKLVALFLTCSLWQKVQENFLQEVIYTGPILIKVKYGMM